MTAPCMDCGCPTYHSFTDQELGNKPLCVWCSYAEEMPTFLSLTQRDWERMEAERHERYRQPSSPKESRKPAHVL